MNDPDPLTGPFGWARLRAYLPHKLALAVGLNLWAMLPYYLLQHHVFYPVTIMPQGPIDRWIPFNPHTVWLYLSLFLLQPMTPMHLVHASQLRRYALGVVAMSGLANGLFLFWPTTIVRPEVTASNALYQHLTTVMTPRNACPSLHAAMAVYSALCGEQLWRRTRSAWRWRSGVWLWALGIIYATLSTKEHVFTDAVAGSALGLVIYLAAFGSDRRVPHRAGKECILTR